MFRSSLLRTREMLTERPRKRRGFSIIEGVAALALLAVLMAFVAQWSLVVLQHRRNLARHESATRAQENVLTRVMAADYEEVTQTQVEDWAEPFTPTGGQWSIEVHETADALAVKEVVIGLDFPQAEHRGVRPLLAWRHRLEEVAP